MLEGSFSPSEAWVLLRDLSRGAITALACCANKGAIQINTDVGNEDAYNANQDESGSLFVGTSTGFILCYQYHIPAAWLLHQPAPHRNKCFEHMFATPFEPRAVLHVERNVCSKRRAVSLIRTCPGTQDFPYEENDHAVPSFEADIVGALCAGNIYLYRQADLHPLSGSSRSVISGATGFWFNERRGSASGICVGKPRKIEIYCVSDVVNDAGCLPCYTLKLPENVQDLLWVDDTLIFAFSTYCACKNVRQSVDSPMIKIQNCTSSIKGTSTLFLMPHDEFLLVSGNETSAFDFHGKPSVHSKAVKLAEIPSAVCMNHPAGLIQVQKCSQSESEMLVLHEGLWDATKIPIAGARLVMSEVGMPFVFVSSDSTILFIAVSSNPSREMSESRACTIQKMTDRIVPYEVNYDSVNIADCGVTAHLEEICSKYQEDANQRLNYLLCSDVEFEPHGSSPSEDLCSTSSTIFNQESMNLDEHRICSAQSATHAGLLVEKLFTPSAVMSQISKGCDCPRNAIGVVINIAGSAAGGRIGGAEILFWTLAAYSSSGVKLIEDFHWTTDACRLYSDSLDDAYLTATSKPIVLLLPRSHSDTRLLITIKRLQRSRIKLQSEDFQTADSSPLANFLWACISCQTEGATSTSTTVDFHPYANGESTERQHLAAQCLHSVKHKADWGSELTIQIVEGARYPRTANAILLKAYGEDLEECDSQASLQKFWIFPQSCDIQNSEYQVEDVQVSVFETLSSADGKPTYKKVKAIKQRWSYDLLDSQKKLLLTEHCAIAEARSLRVFDDEFCALVEPSSMDNLAIVFSLSISERSKHRKLWQAPLEYFASVILRKNSKPRIDKDYAVQIMPGYFPHRDNAGKILGTFKMRILIGETLIKFTDDPHTYKFAALVECLTPNKIVSLQTYSCILRRCLAACRKLRLGSPDQMRNCLNDVLEQFFRFFAVLCVDGYIVCHTADTIMAALINVIYLAYPRHLRESTDLTRMEDVCKCSIAKVKRIHGSAFLKAAILSVDRIFRCSFCSQACFEAFSTAKPLFTLIHETMTWQTAFQAIVQLTQTLVHFLNRIAGPQTLLKVQFGELVRFHDYLIEVIVLICQKSVLERDLVPALDILVLYRKLISNRAWRTQLLQALSASECWTAFSKSVDTRCELDDIHAALKTINRLYFAKANQNYLLNFLIQEVYDEWFTYMTDSPSHFYPRPGLSPVTVLITVMKRDCVGSKRELVMSLYSAFTTWVIQERDSIFAKENWFTVALAECFMILIKGLDTSRELELEIIDNSTRIPILSTCFICLRVLSIPTNELGKNYSSTKRKSISSWLDAVVVDKDSKFDSPPSVLTRVDRRHKLMNKNTLESLMGYIKPQHRMVEAQDAFRTPALKSLQMWVGGMSALVRRSFDKLRLHVFEQNKCRAHDVLDDAIMSTLMMIEEIVAHSCLSLKSNSQPSRNQIIAAILCFCLDYSRSVHISCLGLYVTARATAVKETGFAETLLHQFTASSPLQSKISSVNNFQNDRTGTANLQEHDSCGPMVTAIFRKLSLDNTSIQSAAATAITAISLILTDNTDCDLHVKETMSHALADVVRFLDGHTFGALKVGLGMVIELLCRKCSRYPPETGQSLQLTKEGNSITGDSIYNLPAKSNFACVLSNEIGQKTEHAEGACVLERNTAIVVSSDKGGRRKIDVKVSVDMVVIDAKKRQEGAGHQRISMLQNFYADCVQFVDRYSRLQELSQGRSYKDEVADAIDRIIGLDTFEAAFKAVWLQKLKQFQLKHFHIQEAAICWIELTTLVEKQVIGMILKSGTMDKHKMDWIDALSKDDIDDLRSAIRSRHKRINSLQHPPLFSWEHLLQCYEETSKILITAKMPLKSYLYQRRTIKVLETANEWDELQKCLARAGTTASFMMSQELSLNDNISPSFFRVSVCGPGFGHAGVREFIYCAPPLTPIMTFQDELYSEFALSGADSAEIIKLENSKNINLVENRQQNMNYMQVSFVKPIGKENNTEFFYDLPLLDNGELGHSASILNQWKLRTFLRTRHLFPCRTRRQEISSKRVERLSPVIVASQDLENQSTLIQNAYKSLQTIRSECCIDRCNESILYEKEGSVFHHELLRLLMGSLLVQVNAGPAYLIEQYLATPHNSNIIEYSLSSDVFRPYSVKSFQRSSFCGLACDVDDSELPQFQTAVAQFISTCDEGLSFLIETQQNQRLPNYEPVWHNSLNEDLITEMKQSLDRLKQKVTEAGWPKEGT